MDPVTPDPTGGGGKLASKVGGPKNLAMIGAAGTVALVGLLALRKNSTSSTTSTTTPVDSSTYDQWAQWQAQYEDLQNQISSMQAGTTTAGGPVTTPPVPLPVPISTPPLPTPAPIPSPPSRIVPLPAQTPTQVKPLIPTSIRKLATTTKKAVI